MHGLKKSGCKYSQCGIKAATDAKADGWEWDHASDECADGYPKRSCLRTYRGDYGFVPRRRILEPGGNKLNGHVIGYNPYLSSVFRTMVNVEAVTSAKASVYVNATSKVHKYIHKSAHVDNIVVTDAYDEVAAYDSGMVVTAHEAFWRTFQFELRNTYPAVQLLIVHARGEQSVTVPLDDVATGAQVYHAEKKLDDCEDSTLEAYFKRMDLDYRFLQADAVADHSGETVKKRTARLQLVAAARARGSCLYQDIPKFCKWENHAWVPYKIIKTWDTLGRLSVTTRADEEAHYVGLLLRERGGIRSWDDLLTVVNEDGEYILWPNAREAARASGILSDATVSQVLDNAIDFGGTYADTDTDNVVNARIDLFMTLLKQELVGDTFLILDEHRRWYSMARRDVLQVCDYMREVDVHLTDEDLRTMVLADIYHAMIAKSFSVNLRNSLRLTAAVMLELRDKLLLCDNDSFLARFDTVTDNIIEEADEGNRLSVVDMSLVKVELDYDIHQQQEEYDNTECNLTVEVLLLEWLRLYSLVGSLIIVGSG
ncbi:hypothetical protein KIPB_004536 [Kipferlia bialata]|uniref:Uncharacterized protein n=1 Tax=Kipferlia bialata TaxID=797122 RepID=A0A9K3CW46_9EUKA|nr:hypothetical protein KIPB_004536 [Kipferlia bialata]|eukprot:g4536.t1